MPRRATYSTDDEEPLEDKTAALQLHSKRLERQQEKKSKRDGKLDAVLKLTKLPTELLLECLKLLQPGDVLNFSLVNRRFRSLVHANADVIGDSIIKQRYTLLAQCFPLPRLLAHQEPYAQALLLNDGWQSRLGLHTKPYQHVQSPNERLVCTCLTCVMTWNNLCVALDFAHWQGHLDTGEPIPMIPRGHAPAWNRELVTRSASIATAALRNSLWHARILEMHLDSTVRSIRRQAKNKGNKRTHVDMTEEDAALGTDAFLTKPGPPSLEFPYHRDNYYMLEAYLPNRFWKREQERWLYTIAGQHERDVEYLVKRFFNREPEQHQTCRAPVSLP
ncbi:hypothetical protein K458DRAFT_305560 [Lentithecium fluviatile CBS 122367]|uniref:F-box domain-containing protein n=1 Tax=Lentithecium fluviatile CBS 122367 TaxID=1168545 RepID=A0A6G1IYU7_9PLEO|nr:hypothetical protein K458DRAFT_305560 [Lentithecium fluviatile CBS 122367]